VQSGFRVSVLLGSSFALRQNSVSSSTRTISFSGSCSFVAFSASSRQLSWDTVDLYSRAQATLDLDLGLYTIEHPEIIVGVIVYSIAKRGSQTSFKKSALLSSRALFSNREQGWCRTGPAVSGRTG
jgi:hypothetical protein